VTARSPPLVCWRYSSVQELALAMPPRNVAGVELVLADRRVPVGSSVVQL